MTSVQNLKLATARKLEYSGRVSPSPPRRMGFPLGAFPTQVEHRAGAQGQQKKIYTASMQSSNEKTKRNRSESDSENETANFPRFIVIESLEEVYRGKKSHLSSKKKLFLQGLLRKLLRKTGTATC